MNPKPLEKFLGQIEDVSVENGIQPRIRITVNVVNKNDCGFVLTGLKGRLHVLHSDANRGWGGQMGQYFAEIEHEGYYSSVQMGDQNNLTFYAPVSYPALAESEEERNARDVILQVSISYLALERTPEGALGQRFLTEVLIPDSRTGANVLFFGIAKSRWVDLLNGLGLTEDLRASRHTLQALVTDARNAKVEAVGYAQDAKAASALTAVTTLAQAYDEESKLLNKTSRSWLISAIFIALVSAGLMFFYVRASFQRDFTPSQTILRVFVLAAAFAGLGLCLRYYNNYKHLQLLNRHRVNLGRTFEALKAAQPSDQAKNLLAAMTAEEMVHFGRSTQQGKDASETQLSIVAELLKTFIEKQKS